jgi:hypothetical protein
VSITTHSAAANRFTLPFLPRLRPVANGGFFLAPSAAATQKRSFHTDESEEAMRTNWPAYVAAEMNRIVADEEAFERLVDLFKQAHGRAPASDCEAYQWAQEMDDVGLTALGFGRPRRLPIQL